MSKKNIIIVLVLIVGVLLYFKYGTTKRINELRNTGIKKFWQRNYWDYKKDITENFGTILALVYKLNRKNLNCIKK